MEKSLHSPALYARLLGDSWDELAATVRDMHRGDMAARSAGFMRVSRGANHLARWLAVLLRLPAADEAVAGHAGYHTLGRRRKNGGARSQIASWSPDSGRGRTGCWRSKRG